MHSLIILPCHSIYVGNEVSKSVIDTPDEVGPGTDAKDWILASFQKQSNDQISFLHHIYKAFSLLEKQQGSILVITGGYTKEAVKKSESGSYLEVAKARGIVHDDSSIFLEEYARDSYENVLYSLCLYRRKMGYWPDHVTVVGFEFKRYRFMQQHLKVLEYPASMTEYVGIGPFYNGPDKQQFFQRLSMLEKKNAVDLFRENPFGTRGSPLYEKKKQRDPYHRLINYENPAENVMNTMLKLGEMDYSRALDVYTTQCRKKFPWSDRHIQPITRV